MVQVGLLLIFLPVFIQVVYGCPAGYCSQACFKEEMKKQENSVNKGYKNGMWCPYDSYENDGSKTIAWGHKIQRGENSNCITNNEAIALFERDFNNAYNKAMSDYDRVYGYGKFQQLEEYKRNVSTDIAFNVGNLSSYRKFMEAMRLNDKAGMLNECGSRGLTARTEFRRCIINNNYRR